MRGVEGKGVGLGGYLLGHRAGTLAVDGILGIKPAMIMPDKEGSASFLKKRSKKLLSIGAQSIAGGTHQRERSFLLLFFKKEALFSL